MRLFLVLVLVLMLQSCGKAEPVTENQSQETQEITTNENQETQGVETPESTEGEIVASNNGGIVVEYRGVTYLTKPDEDKPSDSYIDAIYMISENSTEKFTELNSGLIRSMFINDGYLYYTDMKENDENYESYVVKTSLETREKEYLQLGDILYVDIENDEIYYTVAEFDAEGVYQAEICKMNTYAKNVTVLATGNYNFIKIVDNTVYLETLTEDNNIILTSVKTDGTDLKNVLETKSGAYLKDPEKITAFEELYGDYAGQFIVDFGIYKDTIYLSIGGYEGSGNYYYGGLVKVGLDGNGFEPVFEEVENFEIIGNAMYFYTYDVKNDESGISKFDLDTGSLTFLGNNLKNIEAVDEDYIYTEYDASNSNEMNIYNLGKYDFETEEIITIHEGSTAPIKEDSDFVDYGAVSVAGGYIYFDLQVHGFNENFDGWRGHVCFDGHYRVKKDGSNLELIYENPNQFCPK